MLQAEDNFFHGDPSLEKHAGRIEQDHASQQPQDQVAIVGSFPVDLAGLRGQQVLQQAEVVCNPAPPLPRPDQAGAVTPCTGVARTEQPILVR